MDSEHDTLDLIERIYAAAEDQSLWPDFLEHLAGALRCAATNLFVQDLRNPAGTASATFNTDPKFQRSYAEHYAKVNIFLIRGRSLLKAGKVWFSDELCPDTESQRSEFYNEWIVPQGHAHGLLGIAFNDKSVVGNLGAIRGRRQKRFSHEDRRLLRLLMPHLRRAVELRRHIHQTEVLHAATAQALDYWPTAVFVVDEAGRVLATNRSAQDLLREGDGIVLEQGKLKAALSHDGNGLERLLRTATAARPLDGCVGGTVNVPRPSDKRPLSAFVAPASRKDILFGMPGAALVFVTDPEKTELPDSHILQSLYALTPAEARVACLLAQGKDVKDIADEAAIHENSVRVQLKKIFDKTGARRQAELVKLILTGPALLRPRSH